MPRRQAERQPQRGPLGVAAKMVADSGAESLAARRPVDGGGFGEMPT
jgi:hypothetical protein